jgi:tight adherence protein C
MELSLIARVSILGLVFLVVATVAWWTIEYSSRKASTQRRMLGTVSAQAERSGNTSLIGRAQDSTWVALLNKLESRGLSLADKKEHSIRRSLALAGYDHPDAARLFSLIRLSLTLAFPITFIIVNSAVSGGLTFLTAYLVSAGLALIGFYAPGLYIRNRAQARQQELLAGLPDALDLLLVCVEAGLGLDAAFDRVGREMTDSHPLMSDMFGNLVLELRAGRGRDEALRRMAERANVDEIKSFATLLIQSSKLGSSIAQSLRVYSTEMREARRMRAEEKAHRVPVLLSIPLVGCMLPAMVGVLMVPAVIRVIRQLFVL